MYSLSVVIVWYLALLSVFLIWIHVFFFYSMPIHLWMFVLSNLCAPEAKL